MMLCFHAYYKKGEYWKCGDKTSADIFDNAIRKMMRQLLSTLERGEGTNNWNLQKFHEILHLVVQVEQYGNISNTDTGVGERGLKLWAKRHGRRARKASDDIFVESTANMVNELTLITQAHQTMNPNLYSHSDPQEINNGIHPSCKLSGNPKYIITWETDNDETGTMYCNWQSSHDYKGVVELPDEIMDLYEAEFFSESASHCFLHSIYGYTEMFTMFGERCRAHPNYRSEGHMYDWVIAEEPNEYAAYSGRSNMPSRLYEKYPNHVPCRLLALFLHPHTNEPSAFVHMCLPFSTDDYDCSSVLVEHWTLDGDVAQFYETHDGKLHKQRLKDATRVSRYVPRYRVIPINSIKNGVMAIQENDLLADSWKCSPRVGNVMVILDRDEYWAKEFVAYT
jgi:hypothetical protein